MADHTSLNKITHIGDSTLTSMMQDNIVEFFDWGLIDRGGFFNIDIPTEGHYGGNKYQLRLVDDPGYTSGQVWEAFRSNWVWQSGLSPIDQPRTMTKLKPDATNYPNQSYKPGISGVFVGNTFQPTSGVGPYKHIVDYTNGRIVFDSAISTSSTVKAEYTHKWAKVTRADSAFFREIQYRSQRADEDFTLTGSGDYAQLAQTRLQLPVLAIETVRRSPSVPHELGGYAQHVYTDVLFHVLAEDNYTRDKLLDIVSLQEEKSIFMFDSDRIGRNNAFPLDYRGTTNSGALRYPELVAHSGSPDLGYRIGGPSNLSSQLTFKSANSQEYSDLSPNLYHGVVRVTTEVIM